MSFLELSPLPRIEIIPQSLKQLWNLVACHPNKQQLGECGGSFHVIDYNKRNNLCKIKLKLPIQYSSSDNDSHIDIKDAFITFHTHPCGLYIKENVELAWPSVQDLIGFTEAIKRGVNKIHLVIAKEGIYKLQIGKKGILLNRQEIRTRFHENKIKVGIKSPRDACRLLNKDGFFSVEFTSWSFYSNKN